MSVVLGFVRNHDPGTTANGQDRHGVRPILELRARGQNGARLAKSNLGSFEAQEKGFQIAFLVDTPVDSDAVEE